MKFYNLVFLLGGSSDNGGTLKLGIYKIQQRENKYTLYDFTEIKNIHA